MSNEHLLKRIDERLQALGLSDRKASLKAGLGVDGIRTIRKGHQPSAERLIALARALEVNPGYLLDAGAKPSTPSVRTAASVPQKTGFIEHQGAEYASVPRYDAALSAGAGAIVDQNAPPLGYLLFEAQWLRAVTAASPDHLAVVRVAGDSMEPTLHDGDWVLVDRTQNRISREGIYALAVHDACWVKRITLNLRDKMIQVISDNSAYPMQELSEDELTVLGRVVWIVGRKV